MPRSQVTRETPVGTRVVSPIFLGWTGHIVGHNERYIFADMVHPNGARITPGYFLPNELRRVECDGVIRAREAQNAR